MKKISVFLGLLLPVLFFQSCDKKEASLSTPTRISAKQMEFVGVEHNEMLNQAYEFIKTEKIDKETGIKKIEKFLISKINSNEKYSKVSNNVAVEYTKSVFAKEVTLDSPLRLAVGRSSDSLLIDYLDKLDYTLTNVDFNDNSVIEAISLLEDEIEQDENLTDENMITLLSATQVARHSYMYWSENWENWLELVNPDKVNFNKNIKAVGGDIVKGDVAGAVGGAAGAWIINVIPGAGQVGYGGAIIGGAVSASVYVGVEALLDYFF